MKYHSRHDRRHPLDLPSSVAIPGDAYEAVFAWRVSMGFLQGPDGEDARMLDLLYLAGKASEESRPLPGEQVLAERWKVSRRQARKALEDPRLPSWCEHFGFRCPPRARKGSS